MKITDTEHAALATGEAELQDLAHLLEGIVEENSDTATGTELRDIGIAWELLLAAAKEFKSLRQGKQSYEPATN